MSGIEEQIVLTSQILKGKIGCDDVEKELDRISRQYGEECFNSYTVKRKPKPWKEEDLKELQILSASGAASKDFYRYMAEVSEAVFSKKARRKKIFIYIGMAAAIILIAIFVLSFWRANAAVEIVESGVEELYLKDNSQTDHKITIDAV